MKTIAKIPAELSLVVSQGADFVLELSVLENGDPYSFVGATVAPEIMFLDHTTHPVNFSFAVASNVLTLTLSDANTTALGSDSFLWRVTVTKGGDSSDWVAGVLSIVPPGQGGKSPAASATLSLSTAPTVELSIAGGVTGPAGLPGVIAATSPVTYDAPTQTVALDTTALAADPALTGAFAPLSAIPTGGTTGQVLAKDSGTNYDTAWVDNADTLPSPFAFLDDKWVGTPVSVSSGIMQENQILSGSPVFLPDGVITDIGMEVTGAGSSGALIRLCVYALEGLDGTLVWEAGTIDGTSATAQSIGSGTAAVTAGWYFLGAVLEGNPGTRPNVRRNSGLAPFTSGTHTALAGASAFPAAPGLFRFSTTSPLPATVTFFTDSSRSFVSHRVLVKGTWT